MFIQPIDYFLLAWFLIAFASTAYVAWDQFRNNPEPVVMKWGFILVTLYMGPLGLLLYVLADKEPRPGEHEQFVRPLWKQGVGSTIHCVAGDATGIIFAAVVTALLGLPMWIDLIVEYMAGFTFGLFIFQSLFMKSMMGGTYWQNVRKSFMPEFVSMNLMMAGMAPVMSFLMMGRDMRAMDPTELLFWGVMSLGVIVGFVAAYPANVWLVAGGLKHGLMTQRKTEVPIRASGTRQTDLAAHAGHELPAREQHRAHQGSHSSGGEQHSGHNMKSDLTRPQLAAVAGVSILALVIGMVAPANWVNLRLSARAVGGAMMPPGMIMDRNTPAEAMLDMAAVDPRDVVARYGLDTRGDRDLEPRIEGDVRVFELDTSVIRWTILPGVTVDAYAFNGQIPGPRLRFKQGDRVRINVTNHLPETTTVHWHGLILPNVMDGPAHVTQEPIENGRLFDMSSRRFSRARTSIIRTITSTGSRHWASTVRCSSSLEKSIPACRRTTSTRCSCRSGCCAKGLTYSAMPMEGGMPNYFTINGRAYPSTDTIPMRVGETLKVRFIGSNNGFIHPMHIHGGPFRVVAKDGETLQPSARYSADTINVAPGERYDVIWKALRPGKWLIHCHIGHHTTNNNVETQGGGGLMMIINVSDQ